MVSVTDLGERTISYLRKYVFSGGKTEYSEGDGPLAPTRQADFESTQMGLTTVDRSWVRDRVLGWVRDSEEYVIIDIAAGFGSGYERELAQRFPHSQIYMVDSFPEGLTEKSPTMLHRFPADLVFSSHPAIDDPTERMNAMLQANGYRNIRYIYRHLFNGGTGTQLPELDSITRGRHVLVTGICNPGDISLVTAREAAYHGAEECYIVPAGLECVHPYHAAQFFQGTNGMLSDEERNVLVSLNSAANSAEHEEQTRITVKQAFILGLVQRLTKYFTPTVYRYSNPDNLYTELDHLVAGIQTVVMDRSTAVMPESHKQTLIHKIVGGTETFSLDGIVVARLD